MSASSASEELEKSEQSSSECMDAGSGPSLPVGDCKGLKEGP